MPRLKKPSPIKLARIKTLPKETFRKTIVIVKKRPMVSFFVSLLILFLLILAGNLLFKQPTLVVKKEAEVKAVQVFNIGQVPRLNVQAQVQKDGVIVIRAISPGVVQDINVSEGKNIEKGTNLVSLSTNYQGGNAASLQRQLAGVQLKNINETFDTQKEIIQKQKESASQNANNSSQLIQIQAQSVQETVSLLNLNQDITKALYANLQTLINTNTGGVNDPLILATKQQIATVQAGINSLNAQVRSIDYQKDPNNPPTQLINLTQEIALKQLDVQEKALKLSKDVAQIQFNLAAVQEAIMFPAAPCFGVVQKVHVHKGQLVSPGDPLVTMYAPSGNIQAVAKVPKEIAFSVSKLEMSNILLDNQVYQTYPSFISTQATDGQLYAIYYNIPDTYQEQLTNQGYVGVEIPIGYSSTTAVMPFVPLDAVFQTQEQSFVYVVEQDKAVSRTVNLGAVLGGEVEITSGLNDGERVILNRNVIAGDNVKVQ